MPARYGIYAIITKITQNGREAAVVIGTKEYKDFEAFMYDQYVAEKLAEAEKQAADPNTKWLSEDEVWAILDEGLEDMADEEGEEL